MAESGAVDRSVAAGEKLPPGAGLPLVVKENIVVKGESTTCTSKILENFVSPYDAHVTENLK